MLTDLELRALKLRQAIARATTGFSRVVQHSVTMVFPDAGQISFPARDAGNLRRILLARKLA